MAYADYEYYKNSFLGNSISEEDFPRLALRASQFLDYYTRNKAKSYTEDDSVKMACCAVAEAYSSVETADTKSGISSESVGSYSVSYSTTDANEARATLATIARQYLSHTGLLYRGGC